MDDTKRQAISAARVVGHGVDTLLLNAYYLNDEGQPTQQILDAAMVGQLEEWKRMAQAASEPVVTSWSFQGVSLHIRPNGAGRGHCQWLLISRLLTVCV